MSNYIIKKVSIKKAKVNYQAKDGFEFKPKSKDYALVNKVVIIDEDLKKEVLKKKINQDYKKIVTQIYNILNSEEDNGANSLVAYTELQRLKHIFAFKYQKKIDAKILDNYLKKLSILEMEINKLMVNIYQNEQNYENKESRGSR